ncbi:MAG TPA: GAF domain-containing protein, partial [Sphingomicrobium sp.]|nr:GAF domain-containing protein [Sphingomicrobium sp.]
MARSAKASGKKGAAKTRKVRSENGRNPKTQARKTQMVNPQQLVAELRRELDHARGELAARNNAYSERVAYQAAANDVLKLMSASPGDPQPVFDLISVRARDLCDAYGVTVYEFDGSLLHWRAATGVSDDPAEREAAKAAFPLLPTPDLVVGRAILSRAIVHIRDYAAVPGLRRFSLTVKSTVAVPLLRGNVPIGALQMGSRERGGFSDAQVGLLQTFADQAVIAMENATLFNETREALERQTATAEVLKVISRSAFDLEPVLDALLSSACRLCEANIGTIRYRAAEGGDYRLAATFGCLPEWKEHFLKYSTKADRSSLFGRTIIEGRTIHLPDVLADPDFGRPEAQRLIGFRSALSVPLAREGQAFGVINMFRFKIGPFESRQIELLQTFADQAVIAIENTRLFNETKEALERQTATADILKVIARSPDDVQPVFEAIAGRSKRLVNALSTTVFTLVDSAMHLQAFTPTNQEADTTLQAMFPAPLSTFSWGESVRKGEIFRVADTDREPSNLREIAKLRGFRSMLLVPLLREACPIGLISVTRVERGPFSDHHVQLLQTFADQAVIAIQNVELFGKVQARTNELSEALTYQTASANILNVIASSPTDVQPVLMAIVESACQLCEAYDAIVILKDEDELKIYAHHGPIPHNRTRWPNDLTTTSGRAMADRRPVHVHDILSDEGLEFPIGRSMSSVDGCRTLLSVPLLREGEPIGAIVLRRRDVYPFKDKQITLLQTFADQAV